MNSVILYRYGTPFKAGNVKSIIKKPSKVKLGALNFVEFQQASGFVLFFLGFSD